MLAYSSIVLLMGIVCAIPVATALRETPVAQQPFLPFLNPIIFSTPAQKVAISDLLKNGQDYHQHLVSVRGKITQPELHLDETELFLDFVFRLEQGAQSIIVYGRHDRTQGQTPIRMNQSVQVIGTFFKEQKRDEERIFNVLEATVVSPYPSPIPEKT